MYWRTSAPVAGGVGPEAGWVSLGLGLLVSVFIGVLAQVRCGGFCVSSSAGGMSPSAWCRRLLLNQAMYSTVASSSWVRVRQTRSLMSSVLKLSTKLSAIALS